MTDNYDEEDEIRKLLKNLTPREAALLKKRFGIDLDDKESLAEVLRNLSLEVTRERIQEIEQKALRKLNTQNPDPDDAA